MSTEERAAIPLMQDRMRLTKLSSPPFAAWIHLDRPWRDSDVDIFRHLILDGCRYLMITGFDKEDVHDISDDIAIELTNDLVLTADSTFGHQAAEDFLDTRCPERPCTSRYLIVLSDNITKEEERLIEMVDLVSQTI
jgi:hypothetical protein